MPWNGHKQTQRGKDTVRNHGHNHEMHKPVLLHEQEKITVFLQTAMLTSRKTIRFVMLFRKKDGKYRKTGGCRPAVLIAVHWKSASCRDSRGDMYGKTGMIDAYKTEFMTGKGEKRLPGCINRESEAKEKSVGDLVDRKTDLPYTMISREIQPRFRNAVYTGEKLLCILPGSTGRIFRFPFKVPKSENVKQLRRYSVDKCPREEYNSELLLMKHEYYSHGGCII